MATITNVEVVEVQGPYEPEKPLRKVTSLVESAAVFSGGSGPAKPPSSFNQGLN